MMQFDVRDDGTISINPATLAIAEFRAIYERDTTDTRRRAWLELSAIFFMTSMSSGNPYKGYPKEDRISEINMEIFQGEAPFDLQDPEIEKALLKALELDKLSIARDALRTAINGTHKLKMYLDSLKLDERDNQNKPVHNMKQYQETLLLTIQLKRPYKIVKNKIKK